MRESIQAVILAGGKGTRLGKLAKKVPKAMVDIHGKPFLELIIEQLKKNKIKKFLVLTGYKKEIIQNYFKNNNNNIEIHEGKTNWKMLTRLLKAKKLIKKIFLLMYCDNYLTKFNLFKNLNLMKKKKSVIIFSIIEKKSNQNGTILEKINKKIYYKKNIKSNLAEAGYMLIKKKNFFSHISQIRKEEDLPDYLHFFSKKYLLYGVNYKKKFLCIENQYLLKKTRSYFKKYA
jgi:NDP-sugar pyrophosphorylase family protein